MIAWSNTKLKFTSGIGSITMALLMAETFGKDLPFWVAAVVAMPPLIVFLFFQPPLQPRLVRTMQLSASIWYVVLAIALPGLVFARGPLVAGWPFFLMGLVIGGIPCSIVLWSTFSARESSSPQDALPENGEASPVPPPLPLPTLGTTGIPIMKYPETRVLRPTRGKYLAMAIGGAIFVLLGWRMVAAGDLRGWFCVVFFGLAMVAALVNCLPRCTGTVVMPSGLAVRNFFRIRFYPWKEVGGFGVYSVGDGPRTTRRVGFQSVDGSRRWGSSLTEAFVGYNCSLPDNYGIDHHALAAALNAYRSAALNDER